MTENRNSMPEILSAKNLQEMGFSRSMSYVILSDETLPTFEIGKRLFVKRDDFMAWLESKKKQ